MDAGARELAGKLESTLLRADAMGTEVDLLCEEAVRLRLHAVVIASPWVARARARVAESGVRVVSVAGFPLGAVPAEQKRREAAEAFDRGADGVDFVLPLGLLRAGETGAVREEFEGMVREAEARGAELKVILECGLLDEAAIRTACSLALETGIGCVKTSTGFGPRGATVADVRLLRACVGGRAGVKAAGGIRTLPQARALLDAGASRLGTSAAAAIMREQGAIT